LFDVIWKYLGELGEDKAEQPTEIEYPRRYVRGPAEWSEEELLGDAESTLNEPAKAIRPAERHRYSLFPPQKAPLKVPAHTRT
jgi:hypothetical protein